jgi:hypothetical protein
MAPRPSQPSAMKGSRSTRVWAGGRMVPHSGTGLFVGYLIGAGIMLIGGLVEVFLGVQAAGKSLEQITKPLTSTDQDIPTATVTSIVSESA